MNRQRGAAVIVAMLVVALATIVAGNMVFRTHVNWRKLDNAAQSGQAGWLLRAAEQWAAAVLLDDAMKNSVDHPGELWARNVPPVEAEGYQLTGYILEQNGRFNLNGLVRDGKVDAVQLAVFRRLLDNLHLPATLAEPIVDWLDADDETLGAGGKESDAYRRQPQVASPANRPLVNIDELRGVRGMTDAQLDRLRSYVTVLPKSGPININTAAAETIAAACVPLTLDDAYALTSRREQSHFRNVQDVAAALGGRSLPDMGLVGYTSQYFLVVVQARRERIAMESRALFERTGRQFPRLVWRVMQ